MTERGPDWAITTDEFPIVKALRSGNFRVAQEREKVSFDLKTWIGIVSVVVATILGAAKIGHYLFYTRLEGVLLEYKIAELKLKEIQNNGK